MKLAILSESPADEAALRLLVEYVLGASFTKVQASFVVSVENLSDRAVTVQLTDRVPVSESDEVRVSSVKISPEGKPDTKGLLKWDLNLAAKQSKEFRIEYTIEYPNDLPTRKPTGLGIPPSDKAAPMFELHEQIKKLEMKF